MAALLAALVEATAEYREELFLKAFLPTSTRATVWPSVEQLAGEHSPGISASNCTGAVRRWHRCWRSAFGLRHGPTCAH